MSRRSNSKKGKNKKQNIWQVIATIIVAISIGIFGYINQDIEIPNETRNVENSTQKESRIFDLSTIPEYSSSPYVEINNNIPYFCEKDYTKEAFEKYSEWDDLGRSGVAYANICMEIMPEEGEERGEIGSVKDLSRMGTKKI